MKYLKFFENLSLMGEPEIGDYVICEEAWINPYNDALYITFLESNIGQIIDIYDGHQKVKDHSLAVVNPYFIRYDLDDIMRNDVKQYFENFGDIGIRFFRRGEIKYFSHDKLELEAMLVAKNYNL